MPHVNLDTVVCGNEIQVNLRQRRLGAGWRVPLPSAVPEYAERFLRYDPLGRSRAWPPFALESFAGVGNPLRSRTDRCGGDHEWTSGAAPGRTFSSRPTQSGLGGHAIGIDMTDAMLRKAQAAAEEAGLANVEMRRGDALDLSIESASAD